MKVRLVGRLGNESLKTNSVSLFGLLTRRCLTKKNDWITEFMYIYNQLMRLEMKAWAINH